MSGGSRLKTSVAMVLALAGVGAAGLRAEASEVPLPSVEAEVQVSPRLPTTMDAVQLSAAITWVGCPILFQPPVVDGFRIGVDAAPKNPIPCPTNPFPQTYTLSTTLPALPSGTYLVELRFQGAIVAATAFDVEFPHSDLFLFEGGRFDATLTWLDHGAPHAASSVQLTDQSGYFWFFASGNVEVTVKVLDGRAVNGHFWVFAASMTDVPFTLTFTDLAGAGCAARNCPRKSYESLAGKNTNFIDVEAF